MKYAEVMQLNWTGYFLMVGAQINKGTVLAVLEAVEKNKFPFNL